MAISEQILHTSYTEAVWAQMVEETIVMVDDGNSIGAAKSSNLDGRGMRALENLTCNIWGNHHKMAAGGLGGSAGRIADC